MKKFLIFFMILICLCFLSGCTNESKKITTYTTSGEIFIVKEFEGKVAVFQQGSDLPIQILDCIIKDLPPDAIEALATGIKVYDINELQNIIEAYD